MHLPIRLKRESAFLHYIPPFDRLSSLNIHILLIRNSAAVYLARLESPSRQTIHGALDTIAKVWI